MMILTKEPISAAAATVGKVRVRLGFQRAEQSSCRFWTRSTLSEASRRPNRMPQAGPQTSGCTMQKSAPPAWALCSRSHDACCF